jgi:TetR/AcrR family acrAB operon transcriptional repressor
LARSTKEQALVTRARLIDSAERLFERQGVSRTSLQQIAQQAGVTRGAVYWHFADKADLFYAMLERVTLPMERAFARTLDDELDDPLAHLRTTLLEVLHAAATDEHTRRVFEIATHALAQVGELDSVRARRLQVRHGVIEQIAHGLHRAAQQQRLRLPGSAIEAALGLHALLEGLLRNALLDPGAFDLMQVGRQAIDTYLAGLGAPPSPAVTTDRA